MHVRPKSVIKDIIIHISDSDRDSHDDIHVIDKWHQQRGFKKSPDGWYCGYHFFIKKNGTIQHGRDLKWYGQHCKNHNWNSIGICLHGLSGEWSQDQIHSLIVLIIKLKDDNYHIENVVQHSDYDPINKPYCAGFSEEQVKYFDNLIK